MCYRTIKLHFLLLICLALTPVNAQTPAAQTALTAEQSVEQGKKYVQEKQFDKAVESFKQAIRLDANLADAYHGLGSVYVNMGRSSDALEPMKTAARLDPDNSIIRLNLGITLSNLRRADEAMSELNMAKQLSPKDARIQNEIGNLLHHGFNRIEDALAAYIEARRLNQNFPAIHHNIGLMLMRLGRFSEAVAPLQESIRLDAENRNAIYLLSDAFTRVGRFKESTESWTKFLELIPNDPDALTKRSWNYLYAGGNGREAAADARKFLSVHGWKHETSPFLAIMANLGYRQAGMNEEAQAVLTEATKKINSGTWAYNIILYIKGEITGEALLQLAAANNDKKTEAHAYMGMDLLLKGKADEARTHFSWVKDYGNKRFYEYPLAVEELKRLSQGN